MLPLYFHTIRSLQAEQIAYMMIRRAQRKLPWIQPRAAATASFNTSLSAHADLIVPRRNEAAAAALLSGNLRLLNLDYALDRGVPWHERVHNHLWSYTLHYHEWLLPLAVEFRTTGNSRALELVQEVLQSWLKENPPAHGDGWDPYPISVRVFAWIRLQLILGDDLDADLRAAMSASMHLQLAFLRARLERQFLANHYLTNLLGLCAGTLMLRGMDEWHTEARAALRTQLVAQIPADGMHYERTPTYHALLLEQLATLQVLIRAAGDNDEEINRAVRVMAGALQSISRADKTVYAFNDSTHAPVRFLTDYEKLAKEIGAEPPMAEGAWSLPSAGLFGCRYADGSAVAVDFGAPAPRHNLAHAHCGVGTFEMEIAGVPIIVDPGTSGYEGDPLRDFARSSRAHNTITIDGRDESEPWQTFRMARTAKVHRAAAYHGGKHWRSECEWSPFYDPQIRFARTITFDGRALSTRTVISAPLPQRPVEFVHVHPDCALQLDAGVVNMTTPVGAFRIKATPGATFEIKRGESSPAQGWYFPDLHVQRPADALVIQYAGREAGYTLERVE